MIKSKELDGLFEGWLVCSSQQHFGPSTDFGAQAHVPAVHLQLGPHLQASPGHAEQVQGQQFPLQSSHLHSGPQLQFSFLGHLQQVAIEGQRHLDLSTHLQDSGVPSHPRQTQGQQPFSPPLQVSPHWQLGPHWQSAVQHALVQVSAISTFLDFDEIK